jgi:hypothetical protein
MRLRELLTQIRLSVARFATPFIVAVRRPGAAATPILVVVIEHDDIRPMPGRCWHRSAN